MIYGLVTTVTVTVTMLCVTIHRRHLMVKIHNNIFLLGSICAIDDALLICLLLNILTGMGLICSEICFRCGGSYPY